MSKMLFVNNFSLLLLYLFFASITVNHVALAHDADWVKALNARGLSAPGRNLKASSKIHSLTKRHSHLLTVNELDMNYAQGESLEDENNFIANIRAKSEAPVLILEDFDHLAKYIECRPGKITLQLLLGMNCASSKETLSKLTGGLLVTSHYGCNAHGERNVFSVESVDTTEDGSAFILHTRPLSWKQAFRSMEFTMRHSKEGHVFRPQEDLPRRQETIAPVNTDHLPTLTAPVPTAVSTASTNTLDVNHALINQDLLPANSSLQITCTNCSTYGSLDFSFASFEFNPDIDEILSDDLTLGDIFTGGEASIVAHGLGAHVELYTNISRSDDMHIGLFEIPLLFGVRILGIGTAGLLYAPDLYASYEVNNSSIGFSYGFELAVPNDSKLVIDLTDPSNSSVTGFGDSTIQALPFQADLDVNTVSLEVSLRHQIQIGFRFDELDVGAALGIYLDLPGLDTNISRVANVDENCTALAVSPSRDQALAQKVLTDVYKVEPAVFWELGFDGEISLGPFDNDFDTPLSNGTITDVPSTCLNFDAKAGVYVPAEKVIEDAKKKGGGGAMKNGAAAAALTTGLQGQQYSIMSIACGLLVMVGWGTFWL